MGAVVHYGLQTNANINALAITKKNKNESDHNNDSDSNSDNSVSYDDDEINKSFSSTHYFFTSVYLAHHFPQLPESHFILSYIDPFPNFKFDSYENNNIEMGRNNESVSDINIICDTSNRYISSTSDGDKSKNNKPKTIKKNLFTIFERACLSVSLVQLLIYIGSLPLDLQRLFIMIPFPFFSGCLIALIIAITNFSLVI